ncbi:MULTISPECIES: CBS domain-containing protein [Streptomyces]|uniref:CBS domain-containing protein n=1 Tax=Streptomyces tendae TaxID=1932 RepID=A0A6B3QHH8_STRTE|nr:MULTISPECIES: CBS domain-containing protein [unclassified Streptomyces]MBQ0964030.1 BON domain-containing protein [Streptomyces sp. RK74B]MBQ1004018.1 BON domain-containing protein [Streptomyces sp. RK23]MZG19648.1 BON domain-containing protein [Streptomyces sp. SID5914]NEV85765.1 CBS domain-containing protein [Streptomyces tendae]
MPRPVVRGRTDTSFKAVAEALTHNDVTAVPVVDDIGRPVDVVSQADLVRKVARRPDPAEPTDRSAGENVTVEELDDALPEEMSRDVLIRMPGLAPTDMTVHVEEGQVTVEGRLDNQQLVPVIERPHLGVDGVVSVDLHVSGRGGRTRRRTPQPSAPRTRCSRERHESESDGPRRSGDPAPPPWPSAPRGPGPVDPPGPEAVPERPLVHRPPPREAEDDSRRWSRCAQAQPFGGPCGVGAAIRCAAARTYSRPGSS